MLVWYKQFAVPPYDIKARPNYARQEDSQLRDLHDSKYTFLDGRIHILPEKHTVCNLYVHRYAIPPLAGAFLFACRPESFKKYSIKERGLRHSSLVALGSISTRILGTGCVASTATAPRSTGSLKRIHGNRKGGGMLLGPLHSLLLPFWSCLDLDGSDFLVG